MKKVLVTGANGFLGQHLCVFLKQRGYNVICTGRGLNRLPIRDIVYEACDLTVEDEVTKLLKKYEPDVIVHAAAMSKPDECNNDKEACKKANINATAYLLKNTTAHFIYVSTDFIFGEDGPHSEDTIAHPLNFYGETKLASEKLVQESALLNTIVRPVFIYGKTWEGLRGSFLHWVKNNLEQSRPIKVVSDQRRTPTYVEDICRGLQVIIDKEIGGVYHLAGKDILSPYEMAITTAHVLGLDETLIEKVTADTFPEPVKRAKRSGLKIEKAQRELGYEPVSFEEGVRLTFGLV